MPVLPPPCLEAAIAYLERGWCPIALCPPDHKGVSGAHEKNCKSPGKAPLWDWTEYQTRLPRPAELNLWWNRNPHSNVGLAMGPVSGILGIDIDGQAGADLLQSICKGMPDTFNFSTPGGPQRRRLFFKHPADELFVNKSIKINGKEALKIMSKGAQTVMPPSIHPDTGVAYGLEWEDKPMIDPPKALLEYFRNPPHPQLVADLGVPVYQRAKAYLEKCDPCISGSGGHSQAFKVACKMVHGFGLVPEAALIVIMDNYNQRCQPPWTEKEWRHKLKDALEKGTSNNLLEKAHDGKKKAILQFPTKAEPPPIEPREGHFHLLLPRSVAWLVGGWIPLGKLTVLDGDPGLGKSTLLLDIAARVSSHGVGFNNQQGPTGHVILLSAEDSAEDTILPRLKAAGANLDRIKSLDSIKQGDTDRPPEIPADLPVIEEMIAKYQAKLLIIEPLAAYLCGPDANKDQEIRRVLYKLSRIAERHQCAVVTMRHLNKSGTGKAIYRGNMSIGVIGHARVGLLVAEDPDDDSKRVLAMAKINCGPMQQAMRFALEPVPELDVCRIGWLGPSPYSGDQLVSQPTEEQQAQAAVTQECQEWLLDLLAGVEIPTALVINKGKEMKFSERTIQRAYQRVGEKPRRVGNTRFWRLRGEPPTYPEQQNDGETASAS